LDSYQADIQNIFGGVAQAPETLKALTTTTVQDDGNPATIMRQRIEYLMKEEDGSYSYSHLKSKMQTLLLTWCETSIETPELVRLGYRGVTTVQKQQQENESQNDNDQAAATESMDEESSARSKTTFHALFFHGNKQKSKEKVLD
jgi:hypothetical protein